MNKLRLQIGAMSGVVPDALAFSFPLAAEGTACENASLDIEEVPVMVHCPRCNQPKPLATAYQLVCPTCNTPTPEILSGCELELISIEVPADETACA